MIMNRTNFVVMGNQRSGSSLMCRLLDGHPDVMSRQEDLREYKKRGVDLIPFLDQLFSSNPHIKAFGFKIQYSHLTREVEEYLNTHKDIKII